MPKNFYGFTETEFVGLFFCLLEKPKGLYFGLTALSTGMPDTCPLEEIPEVERALASFKKGEGLSELSKAKALPSPDPLQKWKVKTYQVDGYEGLTVSQVTTGKGELVGWFVASVGPDGKVSDYVPLHEPKYFPAVLGGDSDDESEGLQAAEEWEHVCTFRGNC